MNNFVPKLLVCCFLLFIFSYSSLAQSIPSNLSNTHVDDLSDAQIKQFLQQGAAAGLSDDQIIQMAQSKGLTSPEANKLQFRITSLRKAGQPSNMVSGDDTSRLGRTLNYQVNSGDANNIKNTLFEATQPHVFGSELFRNGNLTFSPNLKLATPINYILGPEDQIAVSIYGNSLANWKLDVSPEGNINIPGVGLLNVAGKTIERATSDIKQKLIANRYAIGNGTNLQVTLGNIRSIKVIIMGEVTKPGTYTLPSLATVFNALYAAGGPNANGSFRQIEVIRGNKLVRTLDIYDFLTKGDQKNNIGLQDQDIIRVPTYRTHIELTGEVKTPAIFETLAGETLADVLKFASGFTDQAYTGRIKVLQVNDQQRRITDVIENDFNNYIPLRGDKFIVERILDRYENRVSISGAVFRPGVYQLEKGLTLAALINKAAGLKEDAFTGRASITRLKPDNSRELISFDLRAILNKSAVDIPLQREDSIQISSLFDLRDKYVVSIKGEVRNPGTFAYADSMRVADLIIEAGGFTDAATPTRIEVAQRPSKINGNGNTSNTSVIYTVNLDSDLNLSKAEFKLHPYDIVSVYSFPGYEKQKSVKIEGEVLYPGYYTLKSKNEKISDLILRAGKLTAMADENGSSLKRTNTAILGIDKANVDSATVQKEQIERLQHLKHSFKDSSAIDNEQFRNNLIGINLKEIMAKPGSIGDLILENGDVLRVPKQQQIVRINGEVLYPSAVVYENQKSFNDYVSNAGGYSPQALKRNAYVVYPNGEVKGTRKFLFFNNHPRVKPGSEIYVPQKPKPVNTSVQTLLAFTTGLASLGAIILGILSLHK